MKYLIALSCMLLSFSAFAQEMTENEKVNSKGLDFWYVITNTQEKTDYTRYEVTVYCKNNNETMIYKAPVVQNGTYIKYETDIATFNCTNATGKRLTPKYANVQMSYLTVPISNTYTDCRTNKTITEIKYVQAGTVMQPGETRTRKVIFLTPKGEKPKINLVFLL